MNTHRPDDESVPGEDELGALYRKLPRKEPGPALDAAVLRAAAEAVRASQPAAATLRPARRPRWPIALGSAAILVLAAGLGWRMREMPANVPAAQPGAVTVQQASAPAVAAAPEAQSYAQSTPPAAAPPPPPQPVFAPERQLAPKVRAADSAMAKRAASVESAQLQAGLANAPLAKAPLADQAAPAAAGELRAYAAKPAQRTLEQPRAEAAVAANEAASDAVQPSPAVMAAPAMAPVPAPSADTARNPNDTPAQELDKIRRLLADQHRDEARQRLADFHRDHPDYPLPDDLRTQLLTP